MKTKEIREMSGSDLDAKLAGLKDELFNLRFQMATGQLENPMKIREVKKSIAQILLDEGYIKNFQLIDDGTQGIIRITLKYLPGKERAIQGLRRVSKPGLRVYAGADELPRVLKGLGIAIISTSKGVMTDKRARKEHVGGEVLAFVW